MCPVVRSNKQIYKQATIHKVLIRMGKWRVEMYYPHRYPGKYEAKAFARATGEANVWQRLSQKIPRKTPGR